MFGESHIWFPRYLYLSVSHLFLWIKGIGKSQGFHLSSCLCVYMGLCNSARTFMCLRVCQGTNKWRLIRRPLALSTSSTRTFRSFSLLVSPRLSLHLSLAHSLSNTWQILFMATRAAFLKGAVQRLCRWEQSEGVFERLECTFAHAAALGPFPLMKWWGGVGVREGMRPSVTVWTMVM